MTKVTIRTCPNPVFVIGAPRSGTSVLPWSLAHHSDFCTWDETEFIHAFFGEGQFKAVSQRPSTFLSKHQVGFEEFFGYLGLGLNALLSSRSGGLRWIDQSPAYTMMPYQLAAMFPGASFLHIVRDGRAVVNSMLHFGDRFAGNAQTKELPPWATDFLRAARIWREYVETALKFADRNPERVLTVKNEDLVARTDEEFKRILTFLGAPHQPGPANFFRTSRVNSSFAPKIWGKGTGEGGEPSTPVPTATDAWWEWTAKQRATFTEIAGDLLARLGYPELDPP